MSHQLILYGTVGCHLCEIAEHIVASVVHDMTQVVMVDIAEGTHSQSSDVLIQKYGVQIPVLAVVDVRTGETVRELCWPFTAEAVSQLLL